MGYTYDLLYIDINGEKVGARPTAWDGEDETGDGHNAAGEEIQPISWMTTCPKCADLVNVQKAEIYIATDGTEFCLKCPTCGSGREFKKPQYSVCPEKKETPDIAVFIDPIKKGLFDHPVDHDLLGNLDEELIKLF